MKKILLLFVLVILQLVLIPVDLLLFSVPIWISIGFPICLAAVLIVYLFRKKHKTSVKIILLSVETIIISFVLFCVFCNPYYNNTFFHINKEYNSKDYDYVLSFEQSKEDLDYMMNFLVKNHPAFVNGKSAEITNKYDFSVQNLQNAEQITVMTLLKEMQKVLSSLNDAHTSASWISDNIHYLKYVKEHNDAGEVLVSINGISIDELFERNKDLFSFELKSWAIYNICDYVTNKEQLELLGINVENGVTYTYKDKNGKTRDYNYSLSHFVLIDEYRAYYKNLPQEKKSDFVYFNTDVQNNIAVLTLTSCKYNDFYKQRLREFFEQVKSNNIENIVVDLRNNPGGSSAVVEAFIGYLDTDSYKTESYKWRMGPFLINIGAETIPNQKQNDLLFTGNTYILTSTSTFSSAMMFAEYISDNNLGKIVGEIPGNVPSGYGEITTFKAPNSNLFFSISTKIFVRIDSTKENYILPDYKCDEKDALEKVYDITKQSDI